MEEFEGKCGDKVLLKQRTVVNSNWIVKAHLDEILLLSCRKNHMDVALLLEENKPKTSLREELGSSKLPVEAGEEDDTEKDVGQVAGSGHDHLDQGAEVHRHLPGPPAHKDSSPSPSTPPWLP